MRQERDIRLAHTAGEQLGLITFAQMAALGFDDSAVRRRVAAGRLHRLHRGVYAVGHGLLSARARRLAAVLACGDGAVLSHRAAAAEWNILAGSPDLIDVSVPTHAGRRAPAGIRLHRTTTFRPGDRTKREGVRFTWRQIADEPDYVVATLRTFLGAARVITRDRA